MVLPASTTDPRTTRRRTRAAGRALVAAAAALTLLLALAGCGADPVPQPPDSVGTPLNQPVPARVADLPLKQVIGIGVAQCLSMIPGVSRSGATIMGALSMGVGRKTAAEFSFFLAVPTMVGASTLELADNWDRFPVGNSGVGWDEIAIGFVVSFVVALAVIRAFVAYVSRHGFAPFAWYRIVVGVLAIAWLALR